MDCEPPALRRPSMDSAQTNLPNVAACHRYDERWGASEGADCRVRCQRDGAILYAHSQVLCLASHELRDSLSLMSQQRIVEGASGLCYAISLDASGPALAAALDLIYPGAYGAAPPSWADLEGALGVATQLGMKSVTERCLSALLEPRREWLLEADAPGSVLRWLSISHELRLPELQSHLALQLQRQLPALACNSALREDLLEFAAERLDREAVLQLLRATLEGAARSIPARSPPQSPAASPLPSPALSAGGLAGEGGDEESPSDLELALTLQALMGADEAAVAVATDGTPAACGACVLEGMVLGRGSRADVSNEWDLSDDGDSCPRRASWDGPAVVPTSCGSPGAERGAHRAAAAAAAPLACAFTQASPFCGGTVASPQWPPCQAPPCKRPRVVEQQQQQWRHRQHQRRADAPGCARCPSDDQQLWLQLHALSGMGALYD